MPGLFLRFPDRGIRERLTRPHRACRDLHAGVRMIAVTEHEQTAFRHREADHLLNQPTLRAADSTRGSDQL